MDRGSYTGKELRNYLITALQDKWGSETDALARYVLREVCRVGMNEIAVGESIVLDEEQGIKMEEIISRLKKGEPIQYILGYAYFLNRRFKVNRNVLIPRPETEELVMLACKHQPRSDPRILDIGVGSGCIGISLAIEMGVGTFTGIDKGPSELEVAQENSMALGIHMNGLIIDVLKERIPVNGFDVIISNPPYVLPSERLYMKEHVLHFEPHGALFVPEEHPLIFYRRIAEESERLLNPEGMLLLEINESFGQKVEHIVIQHHFSKVWVEQDIHGKDRFVLGKK